MQLTHVNVWVDDQDAALAFYTDKLGMEVRDDVTLPEMDGFRWLTVSPPDQPEVALTLMEIPGAPVFTDETREQIRSLMAKGVGTGLFFRTDDCQKTYEELSARGVEFTEAPERRPYGLDAGFRDPFGNSFRVMSE